MTRTLEKAQLYQCALLWVIMALLLWGLLYLWSTVQDVSIAQRTTECMQRQALYVQMGNRFQCVQNGAVVYQGPVIVYPWTRP